MQARRSPQEHWRIADETRDSRGDPGKGDIRTSSSPLERVNVQLPPRDSLLGTLGCTDSGNSGVDAYVDSVGDGISIVEYWSAKLLVDRRPFENCAAAPTRG